MEYEYQLYYLSSQFYQAYPQNLFPEIEYKSTRAYACMLIDTHDGYFICVPFRSNIRHKNAFRFKHSIRSQKNASGLDYSKIAIISNDDYLDSSKAVYIDGDEYKEFITNANHIAKAAVKYVDDYILHVTAVKPLDEKEYTRKYGFSTLPYFHDILFP